MPTYSAPLQEMLFILRHVIGAEKLQSLPGQEALDLGTVEEILNAGAELAEGVLAPLNESGDKQGCRMKDGAVTTADGWKQAYDSFRNNGWNGVPFPMDFGGMGLPWIVAFPLNEMVQSANMSFGLCPLLTQGAIEAIMHHGTDAQKEFYLPKLVSGQWTGTMNLTEPQAGSDLAAVRTRAERNGDGTYKIFGSKIFITYGEHDLSDNIIHLVLARLPDGPEGVKGISLFIVPKFLEDGSRNDVACTGLEHKLGIHASPTCSMSFGDKEGARAYLVGQEHEGIKYMFTMMNNARLSVGVQGVAIAERAAQAAKAYAAARIQGGKSIIEHADVKRMILTMESQVQAGRMMACQAAYAIDSSDKTLVDLLTPVVKGWCTDRSVDVASLGVQIHGGMGFIEETGAAQYYRDARILPIYEGTNGIQAMDLVSRKIVRDDGAGITRWIEDQKITLQELESSTGNDLSAISAQLHEAFGTLRGATGVVLNAGRNKDQETLGAIAHPYLTLLGHVMAATLMGRAALIARNLIRDGQTENFSPDFLNDKIRHARFFADHILPQILGLAHTVRSGAETVNAPLSV